RLDGGRPLSRDPAPPGRDRGAERGRAGRARHARLDDRRRGRALAGGGSGVAEREPLASSFDCRGGPLYPRPVRRPERPSRAADGTARGDDDPAALAVASDGSSVFVTGGSRGKGSRLDYATVAYDASTGRQLWASRYDGTAADDDEAVAVGVDPSGSKVFVT